MSFFDDLGLYVPATTPKPVEPVVPPCGGGCPPWGCMARWCPVNGPYDEEGE